jgi:hypothetical protein
MYERARVYFKKEGSVIFIALTLLLYQNKNKLILKAKIDKVEHIFYLFSKCNKSNPSAEYLLSRCSRSVSPSRLLLLYYDGFVILSLVSFL